MGRSVSYPSEALVVTFRDNSGTECETCDGKGVIPCDHVDPTSCVTAEDCNDCDGDGEVTCPDCDGQGMSDCADLYDQLIEDFQQHLAHLFPSVSPADDWIGREDHVLAENRLARFGMSEYCGLVSYWVVPRNDPWRLGGDGQLASRWIKSIADKFVAAFGELSKVGSMSNGEGVYRRIDK